MDVRGWLAVLFVCPERPTPQKKLLQRPTSLEIARHVAIRQRRLTSQWPPSIFSTHLPVLFVSAAYEYSVAMNATSIAKRVILFFSIGLVFPLLFGVSLSAQSDTGTLSGRITDPSGAPIADVLVIASNTDLGFIVTTRSNDSGIYVVPDLHPGSYEVTVEKAGFRKVVLTNLTVEVQDALSRNFEMQIGPVTETITVSSGEIDTSPAVSTVIDQQFVQNMPLNGRTFQSLLGLTPGYVVTVNASSQQGTSIGQLSINGQRANANYFMVDGMSWNFSIYGFSQSAGGAIPAFTVQGTSNSLVPVDAMREFRVLTAGFAPEFGRTPGAQVSIVTRSGTNEWHGTVFDYLRNEAFDARNYFDAPPLPKPPLRQNDFGGSIGAPIRKDRAFFFVSYEGLRLLLPHTATGNFYTAAARANVAPSFQPLLAALPIPNGTVNSDGITAPLAVAYSDPTRFDSYSLRIDYNLSPHFALFGRYGHSPSVQSLHVFSDLDSNAAYMDSLTVGAAMTFGSNKLNDFRINWGNSTVRSWSTMVRFYGAVPPPVSVMYPPGYNSSTYSFGLFPGGQDGQIQNGGGSQTLRQLQFVDTVSISAGGHQLKFGADARQLTPTSAGGSGVVAFASYLDEQAGIASGLFTSQAQTVTSRMYNYSFFGQDVWKLTPRLTLTNGLRWEINTPFGSITPGKPLYNVDSIFNSEPFGLVPVSNFWHTRFNNFAPRVGASFLATPKTIVRGEFGLFYDIGFGGAIPGGITDFPYSSFANGAGPVPFDLSNPAFAPPPFTAVPNANTANLFAVDPNLKLPLVYEWNVAVERALGSDQSLSVTYVGSHGVNLLREDTIQNNPSGSPKIYTTHNADWSNYNALQLQFLRHMSRGLQVLASYTFAKSLDTNSTDVCGCTTSDSLQNIGVRNDYAASSFDVRHSLATAVSYELPSPKGRGVAQALARGWALYGVVHVNSAPPFNVVTLGQSPVFGPYFTRPDTVPGIPFYLPDPTNPGGRRLNAAAFTTPPPGEQGNLPRNYFRGFSVAQTDFAVSRRFRFSDQVSLYFRVEYFNVFNHPMFAPPPANFNNRAYGSNFGKITETLNDYLSGVVFGNYSGGALSPLYQIGGPRSGQLTLRLQF